MPSIDELLTVGAGAVLVVRRDPGRGGLPVRGRLLRRLARDRLGRDGRADEALGLLRLRRDLHARLLRRLALGLEPGRLAVLEGHAGLRRARPSSTTRARSPGSPGAILLGPRIGKFGADGKPNAIPGHNMAFTTLGVIILWFGWFGFNPGSTLSVDFGGVGFFAYVALNTNLAAAAGVLGAVRHVVDRDQEARPLDDAERRRRGARRDHRRVRVRRAVGGDRDRRRRGRDRRPRRARRRAGRHRRPDRRDRRARHGGRLGHALARLPRAARRRRRASRPGSRRALLRRRLPPARRAGPRPRRRRRVHLQRPRSASSG